jgi:epoxyqueuosine reductase
LTEEEFRQLFRETPILRARYRGFLRNVAIAMGNSLRASHRPALERMAASPYPEVADAAQWALKKIRGRVVSSPLEPESGFSEVEFQG